MEDNKKVNLKRKLKKLDKRKETITQYLNDPEIKHFFIGNKNQLKIIEKEQKFINKCLYDEDYSDYLLTKKNFKEKYTDKKDIEMLLDEV